MADGWSSDDGMDIPVPDIDLPTTNNTNNAATANNAGGGATRPPPQQPIPPSPASRPVASLQPGMVMGSLQPPSAAGDGSALYAAIQSVRSNQASRQSQQPQQQKQLPLPQQQQQQILSVVTDDDEEEILYIAPEGGPGSAGGGGRTPVGTPGTLDNFYRRAVAMFGGSPAPAAAAGGVGLLPDGDDDVVVLDDDSNPAAARAHAAAAAPPSREDVLRREFAVLIVVHALLSLIWFFLPYVWAGFFLEFLVLLGPAALFTRSRQVAFAYVAFVALYLLLFCFLAFIAMAVSSSVTFFTLILVCTSVLVQVFTLWRSVQFALTLPMATLADLNALFAERLGALVQRYSGAERTGVIV